MLDGYCHGLSVGRSDSGRKHLSDYLLLLKASGCCPPAGLYLYVGSYRLSSEAVKGYMEGGLRWFRLRMAVWPF